MIFLKEKANTETRVIEINRYSVQSVSSNKLALETPFII